MGSPRFAWGIDVGNRALKAIRLSRDGDNIKIDDFEVIDHEQILSQAGDNRESLLQTALANFAQKHNTKGGAVAIGVAGQASFARFIKLPPVDPGKIPDIVRFEAVQQIPFPLEDVEWSYQLFQAKDSPEVEVGIFAMRRELVNQIIKNFTDVGIQVNAVQMSPLAVYNGLIHDKRIEGTTMIVDVGSENSDLIIADGESIWMRSIPVGGNNFTEALVKSFQLKFPKAEELKRNAATSKYGRQILQAMKPVFSDLVGEIQRSIGFYSSTHRESRIGKVLALGGTFRLPGLQKYLQQNLQLELVRIDRLNAPMPSEPRFATTFNENILSSVGAYGLALQALGEARITSSLLPEKIRRERMWREKVPWFAAAALLFLAGTGITVGKLYGDRSAFDEQNLANKPRIDQITSTVKGLDRSWRDIENSGNEDRTTITNFMTLLSDRDVTIAMFQSLARAFPVPDSNETSRLRANRTTVELVGWKTKYLPNVADLIAHTDDNTMKDDNFTMKDDEFNHLADKIDLNPAALAGDTFNFHGGATTTGKPGAPRGFVVTLLCKTPNANASSLVFSTVVARLRDQRLKPGDRPAILSIERVTIPRTEKVSRAYPTGTARQKKPAIIFSPPDPLNPNAPVQPAPAPDPNAPAPAPYADPMAPGESMGDDSLVTLLAVVVVDPVAKPKKK